MKQTTFASLAWSSKGRTTRRERFLAEKVRFIGQSPRIEANRRRTGRSR